MPATAVRLVLLTVRTPHRTMPDLRFMVECVGKDQDTNSMEEEQTMTVDEFAVAKQMEAEGWEFRGSWDTGELVFTRQIGSTLFSAALKQDS